MQLQGDITKAMNLIRAVRTKLEPSTPGYSVSTSKRSCDVLLPWRHCLYHVSVGTVCLLFGAAIKGTTVMQ